MADNTSNGLTPQQVSDAQHLDNMTSLQQPSAAEQSPITQNGEVKGDAPISSPPTPSPDNPSLFNEPKNPNNKVVEVESQKTSEDLDKGDISDTSSDQGSKFTEDLKGLSGDAINLTITAQTNEQGVPGDKQPELDPGVNKAGGNAGNQGPAGGGGIPRAGQAPAGTPATASPASPTSPTLQSSNPQPSNVVEPPSVIDLVSPAPTPPAPNSITPQPLFIPEAVKVNETTTTTTVQVTTSDITEDATSATFNFTLSNPPEAGSTASLTVVVAGQTYTVPVNAAGVGTLTISGLNNADVYQDSGSLTATVTSINGGNFEATSVTGATATAAITETTTTTTVQVTTSDITEDATSATFNFTLSNPPEAGSTASLTVVVAGQTYTVPVNAAGVGTLTISGLNNADVYQDSGSLTATVTSINGGNFEATSVTGATATAAITETTTTTTVQVTTSDITEDATSATFNFTLSNPPEAGSTASLTVVVAGQTYTVPVNAAGVGTLTISGLNNADVYQDSGSLTATVTSINGGNFEATSVTGATATAAITETTTTTTVQVTTSDITEDATSATFNFTLSNPPEAGSTASLTVVVAGQTYTVPVNAAGVGTLTISGLNNADVYQDSGSLTATVTSINGGNFEATSVTGATATAAITETTTTTTVQVTTSDITEDATSATFNFTLSNPPEAGSTASLTVVVAGQTYTVPVNAAGVGTLTISGLNNADVYQDSGSLTATVTSINGGNFEATSVTGATATAAITETTTTTTVQVTTSDITEDATSATFNFTLSNPPEAGSTASLTVVVAGQTYTVPVNAAGVGTLTISGLNNADVYQDSGSLTATVTSINGGNFEATSVTGATATAAITETTTTTTVQVTTSDITEDATSATFNFTLSNPPEAGSTASLTVVVAGQTYTVPVNAAGVGTLTISGLNNADVYQDSGSLTATVTSINGGNFEATSVTGATATAAITETTTTTTVQVTTSDITEDATSATFNFTLSNPPEAGSTASLTVVVAGQTYTVPVNAAGVGTLTISGLNNADVYQDSGSLTATVTSINGGNFEATSVTGATATAAITETTTTTTVQVTTSDITEDATSATFNFTLSNPPEAGSTASLTVVVAGQTYTVPVNAAGVGTLTISGLNNADVYQDSGSLTATVTSINGGNFEATSVTGATATAAITETTTTTTVQVTTSDITEDATSATFNFTLSNPPEAGSTASLTVVVAGQTYTVPVNAAGVGTLTISGLNNADVYQDSGSLTATVTSINGGNFEATSVTGATATAAITETTTTTTVQVTTSDITEDATSATFNFTLSNPPEAGSTASLTVVVAGQTYTVPVNAAGVGTLTISGLNNADVYQDSGSLTATVTSINGGNFEATSVTGATATAAITETTTTTTVQVTTSDITEDATSATFNFTLSNPPEAGSTASLTVVVAGQTYTVPVNAAGVGTLTISGLNNADVYQDSGSLTATVTSINGGNFEATSVTGATATAAITETTTTTTVQVTTSDITEDATSATFNFTLSNPPEAGSTASLTVVVAGQTYTVPVNAAGVGTLTISGLNNADVYQDSGSLTATVTSINGGNFEATSVTGATATAAITETTTTTTVQVTTSDITEDATSATFNFTLSNPPEAGSTASLTVVVAGQTYTVPVNAAGVGTLTISGLNNADVYQDSGSLTATVTSINGGNFEATSVTGATATAAITETTTTTTVQVTTSDITEDATSATFNFTLSNPPEAGSTASLTVVVAGQTYTVPVNAAGVGTLTISGLNNADVYQDSGSLTATVTSINGGNFEATSVTGATATAAITETTTTTTVQVTTSDITEDATSATFNFTLSNPPEAGSTASLTVVVAGQTYTVPVNAAGVGTLTISGLNNADVYQDSGSLTATVTSINGGNFEATSVTGATATAAITETTTTTTVQVTTSDITEDATSATFNFTLSNPPEAGSTASLTVVVAGQTYTVPVNAAGVGTLTISGLNNADVYQDSGSLTATVTSINGGNFEATSVTGATATAAITETTTTTYVQLYTDATVNEDTGARLEHTIRLVDENGNAVNLATGKEITVTLSYNADSTLASDFGEKQTSFKIIGNGASTYSFANTVLDDLAVEGTESYNVRISSVVDGPGAAASGFEALVIDPSINSATGTILDNDVNTAEISIWKTATVYNDTDLLSLDGNNKVDTAEDFIKYTITVKNTGADTLTSITLTDEKLSSTSYTLKVGTYNESTGVFTQTGSTTIIGTLSNGELSLGSNTLLADQALQLVYKYDVTTDDLYSNTISNTVQVDTNQTNPQYKDASTIANDGIASYEILVENPIQDVAIRKFADVHTATLNTTVNYTLIVTNEGNTNLTQVKIADNMFATAGDSSITAGQQISGYIYTNGIRASTATNFTIDANGKLDIGTLATNEYVEINYSHLITTTDLSYITTGLVESVFDYTGISKGPYNPDGNSGTADAITMSYGTFSAYINQTTTDPYATGGAAANIFVNTDNTGMAIGVNAGVMSGDRNYNSDHLKAVFNTSALNGGQSLVEKASIVFTNAKDVEVAFKAGYGVLDVNGAASKSFIGSIIISNTGTVSLSEVNGGLLSGAFTKTGSTTTFNSSQFSFSVTEAPGPGGAQNKLYTLQFDPGSTDFIKDFDFWVVGDPTDNSSDQIKVVDVLFDTIDFSIANIKNTAIVTSNEDDTRDQSDEIATVDLAVLTNLSSSAVGFLGELAPANSVVADTEATITKGGQVQWVYTKTSTSLVMSLTGIEVSDANNAPSTIINKFEYTLDINGSTIKSSAASGADVTFNLAGITGIKSAVFHLYSFDSAGGRTEFIATPITIDTSKNKDTGTPATLGIGAPVALDLNGDGVRYLSRDAEVTYDFNGDGIAESTAWVASEDGLLALQRSDGTHNIVFSTQAGETDLEGLAKVYDTNHDNVFDAQDAGFNQFGVWQDADSDGVVDAGEFLSLADRGIISLSLTSDGVIHTAADGDVTIYGQTTYTMTDGSTGIAEDVGFSVGTTVGEQGVDGVQEIYQIASVTDTPIVVDHFSADDRDRIDLSSILNPTNSIQATISIDADGSTSTHSTIAVNIGGVDYEVATLYGKDIGVEDALGTHPGGASLTDSLNGASWTDVVDISSDHGGPASIFADGGSLTNSFSNEAGDWTVQIKSGTATVDALNKQITFSSDNSENLAIITTADGTSHEITNVDKILWH